MRNTKLHDAYRSTLAIRDAGMTRDLRVTDIGSHPLRVSLSEPGLGSRHRRAELRGMCWKTFSTVRSPAHALARRRVLLIVRRGGLEEGRVQVVVRVVVWQDVRVVHSGLVVRVVVVPNRVGLGALLVLPQFRCCRCAAVSIFTIEELDKLVDTIA